MKKLASCLLFVVCFFYTIVTVSALENTLFREVDGVEIHYIRGELLIQSLDIHLEHDMLQADLREVTITNTDLQEILTSSKTRKVQKLFWQKKHPFPSLENWYLLTISPQVDPWELSEQLQRRGVVAHPNFVLQLDRTPNDPLFSQQWGLHNIGQTGGAPDSDIDAPEAWDIQIGNSHVVTAVIDTGVDYNHPDLTNNIWHNLGEVPNNNIDDDSNGYVDDYTGWDFVDGDNNPLSSSNHGTLVAGVVAAVTNNNVGVAGTCWDCKIMILRAIDGPSPITAAAESIVYAVDNGAHITSNSYSFPGNPHIILEPAFQYAEAYNVLSVASASNEGRLLKVFPAGYDYVVSVAATNHNDHKLDMSNYGSWVDVAAPGTDILTTTLSTLQRPPYPQGYDSASGTSLAVPFVSGLAGLLRSYNPSLTATEIRNILRTATDTPRSNQYYIGVGRINAYSALLMAISGRIPNAQLVSSLDDYPIGGGILEIKGTANGLDFQDYTLSYGSGIYPGSFFTIASSTVPVTDGMLGTLDMGGLNDGDYTIRLTVRNRQGVISKDTAVVNKGCTPLTSVGYTEMYRSVVLCPATYINRGIIIHSSGFVLDCNGAVLQNVKNIILSGVVVNGKSEVVIKNCIFKDYPFSAIHLMGPYHVDIFNNVFIGNNAGIGIETFLGFPASQNRIFANTFLQNRKGISSIGVDTYNNELLNNNFLSNNAHIDFSSGPNLWSTPLNGGNYWDSHNCRDNNLDGFCDSAYVINQNNQDNLPLVHPNLLFVEGTPAVGRSFKININDPLDTGKLYITLFSFSKTPVFQLSDGRTIYLTFDGLLFSVLVNPGNPFFQNTQGILDQNGRAAVTVNVPNEPFLSGASIYTALIVVDSGAPSGIARISHTQKITIA